MRAIGAITGSRTLGTIAGIAVVALPVVIVVAIGATLAMVTLGALALTFAIPIGAYIAYRRVRTL